MGNAIEMSMVSKIYSRHKKQGSLVKDFFSREYEEKIAVVDFCMTVAQGEIVGLMGQNGAGKTTIMKMLSGITTPSQGEISVLSQVPQGRKNSFLHEISFIMGQKHKMWWDISAYDNFLLYRDIYQVDKNLFEKKVQEMSEFFLVDSLLNVPVRTLSLGERTKCEIICSLLHDPKVIFLDEPTLGLDIVSQKRIRDFFLEYRKKEDVTIILTSHYLEDIEQLCDRVVLLDHGKKYFDGFLSDFLKEYADSKILKVFLTEETARNIAWEDFGLVIDENEEYVKLEISKSEYERIKAEIAADSGVKYTLEESLSSSEIMRKHFEGLIDDD